MIAQVDPPGVTAEVRIGEIEASVDLEADTAAGTITAPWLSGPLGGFYAVDGIDDATSVSFQVDPDGGQYSCDFGAEGWGLAVQANDTDLTIVSTPRETKPLPDSDLVWDLEVCNVGATSSASAKLAMTGTTVVVARPTCHPPPSRVKRSASTSRTTPTPPASLSEVPLEGIVVEGRDVNLGTAAGPPWAGGGSRRRHRCEPLLGPGLGSPVRERSRVRRYFCLVASDRLTAAPSSTPPPPSRSGTRES